MLRSWELKSAELKALNHTELVVFATRCVIRVEGFRPTSLESRWEESLQRLLSLAVEEPDDDDVSKLARTLSDLGAIATYGNEGELASLYGQCANRAALALAVALTASVESTRAARVKGVIAVAKQAGAIPALVAHAGLYPVSASMDAVDEACERYWGQVRDDIALFGTGKFDDKLTVDQVRELGPLEQWPLPVGM